MHGSADDALGVVAVSFQDVAWVVVLVLCTLLMVLPFVFWTAVMITRRKEQREGVTP
jgi:hypothetical protein